MATGAEIQAALADAKEFDLSFDDMAVLLKRAIANAMVTNATQIDLPWQSTASRGTQIARMSLEAATELMIKFQGMSGGGVIGQYIELANPGTINRNV